jgi:hypothetical protein
MLPVGAAQRPAGRSQPGQRRAGGDISGQLTPAKVVLQGDTRRKSTGIKHRSPRHGRRQLFAANIYTVDWVPSANPADIGDLQSQGGVRTPAMVMGCEFPHDATCRIPARRGRTDALVKTQDIQATRPPPRRARLAKFAVNLCALWGRRQQSFCCGDGLLPSLYSQ